MKPLVALGALSLLSAAALTAGCGGGSAALTASATGRATVSIAWPEVSRLIPVASSSITVRFLQNGSVVAAQTVSRPDSGGASSLSFLDLPTGELTVTATAYPNTDGTGTAQAAAATAVTIVSGQTVPVALTMASTIGTLSVAGTTTLPAGTTTQLGADAQNSAGAIVLLAAGTLSWTSSNTGVATVSAAGLITAVSPGTTQIQVTDSESGRSASVTVTVTEPVSVTLLPASVALSVRGTQAFGAVVNNTTNQSVTWKVQESQGGTITNYGLYTAPSITGTYHVIATSAADPTKSATATITVQAGSATVTVN